MWAVVVFEVYGTVYDFQEVVGPFGTELAAVNWADAFLERIEDDPAPLKTPHVCRVTHLSDPKEAS